jgi:membrane protein DedA with SNARE-associated domain
MTKPHEQCTSKLIVNWLGVLAILALASAVGLSIATKNDATTIVTIVGITASVASGLIGYLGGRAAQTTVNANPTDTLNVNSTQPEPEA